MRVLLIEDNAQDQFLMRRELEPEIEVVAVNTLAGAMKVLAGEQHFDCVLVDLGLPDSDYRQTLTALKTQSPGAIAVVISGHDDPALIAEAIKQGANAYLVKGQCERCVKRTVLDAVRRSLLGAE